MIHDIAPKVFLNSWQKKEPSNESIALIYHEEQILLVEESQQFRLPTIRELQLHDQLNRLQYCFTIDEQDYYIVSYDENMSIYGYHLHKLQILRTLQPMWIAFAGITGSQLFRFYRKNKYCGTCGSLMEHSETERAMVCSQCQNIVYPAISPAVIVGVTYGDSLLMTKYANREYTNYALIAGFVEVGETLEQCVIREVKEETGVDVTNIRYFKSQPWSFSDSLLAGFFADLTGSPELTIDHTELAIAEWIKCENIPPRNNNISLTQEMIDHFRDQCRQSIA